MMNLIQSYKQFLISQYKQILHKNVIDSAQKNKQKLQIIWNNGVIGTSEDVQSLFTNFQKIIPMTVDFKQKKIKIKLFDDRGDFKSINRIKQAVTDLIRAKYIDSNWSLHILSKEDTKENLGGMKVNDLLKYNSTYQNIIPFAFHGTSSYYLKNIKRVGLQQREYSGSQPTYDEFYTQTSEQNVYLTIDYDIARSYAQNTVQQLNKKNIRSYPIVIKFKDLPVSFVNVDDDLTNNLGMMQFLAMLERGKKEVDNYIKSIRASSQFAYTKRIPAKFIDKIIKVKEE